MSSPDPRPDAVESATAWLREHDATYSEWTLGQRLRDAGYTEAEISAAGAARSAERERDLTVGPDLRMKAAGILVGSFFAVWAAVSLVASSTSQTGEFHDAGFESAILGVILGGLALLTLPVIAISARLRRGVSDAMLLILALPFLLMFCVAGICLAYEGQFR